MQMEEKREVIKMIKQKKQSWEELTSQEQELLDTFKEKFKGKKSKKQGRFGQ
jgi:predicted site-specific integrase-resolvase